MVKSKSAPKTYFTHVKDLLDHWQDVAWLGTHSPLATPYFLGEQLHGTAATAETRGTVLVAEMERALQGLWRGPMPDDADALIDAVDDEEDQGGRGDRYDYLILELNYLKRLYRPAPKSQSEIYNDILHISRPTHDRHLAQAVERLGTILLQRLRPTIRPERPPAAPTLIGREEMVTAILADLTAGRDVSLVGPGGVGKTSLGAALCEGWVSPAVFWFTFRTTFNDHIDSLLFALGHFLHTQGASTLWHQLIADGGRLQDGTLALGLIQTDLAALPQQALLCFDELDVLRPPAADQPNPRHSQLLELLDSLRGQAPMLRIGQQAYWESNALYTVATLTEAEVAALLTGLDIPHRPEDVARLYYYSGGNPRLITLCAALYGRETGESFTQVLDQLPGSPTLLPLWHRLARRLTQEERQLAQALSVFRSPAPSDVWNETRESSEDDEPDVEKKRQAALMQLIVRRLVIRDQQGALALVPALREVIYGDLPIELREGYHLQAAQIRAERGEYTPAAHHLHSAGQEEAAVTLWHTNRSEEINRGQAGSALGIFEEISLRRLKPKTQKTLRLVRAELYQLLGKPDAVVATLKPVTWSPEEREQIDAALLLGKAFERQGEIDQAHNAYATAVKATTTMLAQTAELHVQRSLLHLHERDLDATWQEVHRARYLVESVAGMVHEQSGDFDAAERHYSTALALAESAQDQANMANIYLNLGNLAMRQMQIDEALDYYNVAMKTQQTIGDRVAVEIARSGLAATYMQAQRYLEALAPAKAALTFFQAMGHVYWTAINASNLAEIYTELDELENAETQARLVLEQEEPHSHPYALFTMGRVRSKQRRLEEALLYMDQAGTIAKMNGDRFLLAYCYEEMGKIQQTSEQSKQAVQYFEQAHGLFSELGIANKAAEVAAQLATVGF